jgi:hypothetical protein
MSLTNGGLKVLVERMHGVEWVMAEITLEVVPVPRLRVGFVARRARPADELIREDTAWVLASDFPVQLIAVEVRPVGTRSRLEVMGETGHCREIQGAEDAFERLAPMYLRVQVLRMRWFVS